MSQQGESAYCINDQIERTSSCFNINDHIQLTEIDSFCLPVEEKPNYNDNNETNELLSSNGNDNKNLLSDCDSKEGMLVNLKNTCNNNIEISIPNPIVDDEKKQLFLFEEERIGVETVYCPCSKENDSDEEDEVEEGSSSGMSCGSGTKTEYPDETFCSIGLQVFIPFLMAGMGMVGAGVVLDIVQYWPVFKDIPETIVLVPALLGLKGNLEMTLASRLSTQANLGTFDNIRSHHSKWKSLVFGNLCLVQCQAITIGVLASTAAILLGWIPEQDQFDWTHALILCVTSVITASLASLILGIVMVLVIISTRHLKMNPDNIATPIASLGDIVTLTILAFVSKFLYSIIYSHMWIVTCILAVYLMSMPVWIHIAKTNSFTKDVLYNGWTPILSAVVISSLSGLVLDYMVKLFHGIAIFQPVTSGVGGNLVAVQASRISTHLHCQNRLGKLPEDRMKIWISPLSTFFRKGGHSRTARTLVLMVIPGHIIFAFMIRFIRSRHVISSMSLFLVFYLSAALIQVVLLLYIAEILVHFLWSRKIDPDSSAIPYLTSSGDFLGTTLLAIAFLLYYWTGYGGEIGSFHSNH